jgi:NAD(P)-dependent dehydrogenase (short-subunit alcohol dehydrogenase family)
MKVILVTGASRGIGLNICKKFKENNWTVVGVSIKEDFTSEFIDDYLYYDLADKNSPENIISFIKQKYNQLDCIVNNAACQICKPIWQMEVEEWDKVYNVNVRAIFLFAKYGKDLLAQTKGNIINIGSVHSVVTSDKIAAYASTKAAINGLTKNLAIELGPFGIRVNNICPGAVDTEMLRDGLVRGHAGSGDSDTLVNNLGQSHLLGRVGKPEEIANFVYFVGEKSNGEFINGASLLIDGGACIKLSTE